MAGYGGADDHLEAVQIHIEESLARHKAKIDEDNNTSGICIDCDSPIPKNRLAARPGCSRCIVCQQYYEESKCTT